jgi:hypothetical protein
MRAGVEGVHAPTMTWRDHAKMWGFALVAGGFIASVRADLRQRSLHSATTSAGDLAARRRRRIRARCCPSYAELSRLPRQSSGRHMRLGFFAQQKMR